MGKFLTTASSLALTAILSTGIAYAIEGATPQAEGGLTILASTPAEGAAIAVIEKEERISITPAEFAEYPEMYITYEVEQKTADGWENYKSYTWLDRNEEEGVYSAAFARAFEFFEGVEYRFVYKAWETVMDSYGPSSAANMMGMAYVNFTGTAKGYECSPYKLTSISPEPSDSTTEGYIMPSDCPYITVIFDGPVNLGNYKDTGILMGMGMGNEAFASLEPVDGTDIEKDGETTTYAKEWHLVFAPGYLAYHTAPLYVTIKARDEEGRVVQGNMGKDEGSYNLYSFNVEAQYAELTFDFGKAPLANVESIVVGQEIGINFSYMKAMNSAKVYLNGEAVASVADIEKIFPEIPKDDEEDDEEDDENTSGAATSLPEAIGARIIFDKALTEAGTYTLNIPAGYFNIGTEFNVLYQKEETVTFDVVAAKYTISPEAGVVTEIGSFAITYDVDGDIELDYTADRVTMTAEDGTSIPMADFNAAGKTLSLALRGTITDPGVYTLRVPTGFVKVNGEAVPGVLAEYVIEKQGGDDELPATFDPAPGEISALPEYINIIWTDWPEVGSQSGIATIQFNDEAPVNLPDLAIDYDNPNYNEITQPLGEFAGATAEGTYTITFPAGYFNLGWNGDTNEQFSITYTIGGGTVELPVTFKPDPSESFEALPESIEIWADGYEEIASGQGFATISFNNGEPERMGDISLDWDYWNLAHLSLAPYAGATEKGEYKISFPAGFFTFITPGEVSSPAMEITYTVGANTGVTNVTVKADRYMVFDLNGVQVLDTTDAEALKTLKGIYIVNGIKIAF